MAAVRDGLDGFLGRATEMRVASLELHDGELPADDARFVRLREEAMEFGPMVEACESIPAPPDEPCLEEEAPMQPECAEPAAPVERHFVFVSDWLNIEEGASADDTGTIDTRVEISTEWIHDLVEGSARNAFTLLFNAQPLNRPVDRPGGRLTAESTGGHTMGAMIILGNSSDELRWRVERASFIAAFRFAHCRGSHCTPVPSERSYFPTLDLRPTAW